MKNFTIVTFIMLFSINANASPVPFFNKVCPDNPPNGLQCIKVQKGDTWKSLTKNYVYESAPEEMLMNLNRTNKLTPGNWFLIPNTMWESYKDYLNVSPFPKYDAFHTSAKGHSIIVSPKLLAWGLYNRGEQVAWGLVTPGKDICEKKMGWAKCRSPVGEFKVMDKKGEFYRSTMYPIDCPRSEPCAPMPWAMHVRSAGEALHASTNHPGRPDSHGCYRLLLSDAKYLQEKLSIGDKILVLPYE